MYYILVKYYYHNNTLYAPKDSPMVDAWGQKLTFKSVDEARSFLASIDVDTQLTQQTYTTSGWHSLAHGEYDRSIRGSNTSIPRPHLSTWMVKCIKHYK